MAIAPLASPAHRWPRRLAAALVATLLLGGGLLAGRLSAPTPPTPPAPPAPPPRVIERVVTVPAVTGVPCPDGSHSRDGHFAPIESSADGSSSLDLLVLCAGHYVIVDAKDGVRVTLIQPDQANRTVALPLLAPHMYDHYRWRDQVAAVGDGRRIVVVGTRASGDGHDQVAFLSDDEGVTWNEAPLGRDLGDINRLVLTTTQLVLYVGVGKDRHSLAFPLAALTRTPLVPD